MNLAGSSTNIMRLWPYATLAALLLIGLTVILALNGGIFTYTLDDPYIHLAFSEQLARGHFGLVAQERASPSSSVLYPLLLLPLVGTALHQFQPLFWNLLAVFAALWLWRRLFTQFVLSPDATAAIQSPRPDFLSGCFALLAVVLLNHAGLVFSGMEAGLQIACSLATAIGLIELLFGNRLRWWLIAGIILGPLLRYESLTIALPAIAILASYGRWRWAAICAALVVFSLGGYALYCRSIGLPPLPGSLLLKTGFDDPSIGWLSGIAGEIKHLFAVVIHGRSDLPVVLLIGLLALNFLFCPTGPARRRERSLVVLALFALLAQFVFGGHGSLGRYDTHVWSCGVAIAVFVNRRLIRRALSGADWRRGAVIAAALLLCVFPYSAFMFAATPLAAHNIYLQQFQLRRFLVDFSATPALLNDVGLAAYRNPSDVIDVIGLGSEQVRRLRLARQFDAAALQRIAQARNAGVALLYTNMLGNDLPPQWTALARLKLDRLRISVAGDQVIFYAVRPEDAAKLTAQLKAFADTLPAGASLEIVAPP